MTDVQVLSELSSLLMCISSLLAFLAGLIIVLIYGQRGSI